MSLNAKDTLEVRVEILLWTLYGKRIDLIQSQRFDHCKITKSCIKASLLVTLNNMSLDNLMDSKVEAFCIKILTTDSEFWEARNKAVLGLTSLIIPYEGAESSRIQEVFNTNIFRLLKDPIKDIISDLRSQQIRDVCLFLIKLSEITRDHMKLLLREIFCFILDAVKVPNRVMSGYVDNAVLTIIKNTTFKSCIPSLVSEIRDSKAKMVRERCLVS